MEASDHIYSHRNLYLNSDWTSEDIYLGFYASGEGWKYLWWDKYGYPISGEETGFQLTDSLYLDGTLVTTGNVGIGTTAPDALLDIASASGKDFFNISDDAHGDIFTVDSSGNVGIGTASPGGSLGAKLDVVGIIQTSNGTDQGQIRFRSDYFADDVRIYEGGEGGAYSLTIAAAIDVNIDIDSDGGGSPGNFRIKRDNTTEIILDENGNVGIGDDSPDATLEIVTTANNAPFMISSSTGGDGDIFIVDSSGNVGIGTTTPGAGLHVGTNAPGRVSTSNDLFVAGKLEVDGRSYFEDNAYFFDGGNVADNKVLTFGDNNDWGIQYQEGTDDQLLLHTVKTSAIATTDPMFQILTDFVVADGTGMTADQQVFGIAKGTQASNIDLFTVDEDGDGYFAGNVGIGDTTPDAILEITTNSSSAGSDYFYISTDESTNGDIFTVDSSGNVGIGTATPELRLTLDKGATTPDGGILAIGTFGAGTTLSNVENETKLLWYPKKAAFRAGQAFSSQWSDANIGNYSVAFGNRTQASGEASVAMGYFTRAAGSYSTALGEEAYADGAYSFVAGQRLTADSANTIVLGRGAGWANNLINNIASSLMVGFNSTIPTLFVGTSNGMGTAGRVGIGGDSNPDAILEITSSAQNVAYFMASSSTTGDGDIFIVDSNGNVGIGDDSPDATLEIVTTANNAPFMISSSTGGDGDIFTVDSSGNVGIGTVSPGAVLDVRSVISIGADAATTGALRFPNNTAIVFRNKDNDVNMQAITLTSSNKLSFGDTNEIFIDTNNRVGIGNTGPGEKLSVAGNLHLQQNGEMVWSQNGIATDTYSYARIKGIRTNDLGTQEGYLSFWTKLLSGSLTEQMRIDQNGNVGIGDDSPDYPLEILSTTTQFAITHTDTTAYTEFTVNSSGNLNIRNNNGRIFEEDGSTGYNLFIGEDAFLNDSGVNNVGIGYQAGQFNNTEGSVLYGRYNVYIGHWAGRGSGTGDLGQGYFNVAIGQNTLTFNTTGYNNTAIGRDSMKDNTIGKENVGVGAGTLRANSTGTRNVAIGFGAMNNATGPSEVTAIGANAGARITTSQYSVMIGESAQAYNETGRYNTVIGWEASGTGAGAVNSHANNTVIGARAGYNVTTGGDNIFLGYQSGYNQTTNSNLLIIDNQDRGSATLEATNSLIYGSFNATPASQTLGFNANVGIYDSSPDAILEITSGGTGNDFFHITSGTTDGDIFTIDSNGNVGIGDTSPDYPLEILDTTTHQLALTYTDGAAWTSFYTDSGGDLSIHPSGGDVTISQSNLTIQDDKWIGLGSSAGRIVFDDQPTDDYMSVMNANVGIGDTTPDAILEITTSSGSGMSPASHYLMVSSGESGDGDLFIVDSGGNVGIGSTASPSANGGKVLFFGDNTADPTMDTNTAGIYAKDVGGTVEIFVVGEDDVATQISPHNPETGEWRFYSKNLNTGYELKVEMEQLVKFIDAQFNTNFVHEYQDGELIPNELIGEIGEDGLLSITSDSTDEASTFGIISFFTQKVKDALSWLGLTIENGIAQVRELVVNSITGITAKFQKVEVDKLQMKDAATGEIYCTWIEHGQWKKVKAQCDQIEYLNGQMYIINEDEIPEYIDEVPTPEESEIPEAILDITTPSDAPVFEPEPEEIEASTEAIPEPILEIETPGA